MKILFLTLKTFSASSAIEKVCRVAGRAMYEYTIASREDFTMHSMHDPEKINTHPYLPTNIFKGFGAAKAKFAIKSVREGVKSRVVVLGHINLLLPGYLIKLLSPKTKLIIIVHGLEVWEPLSPFKKKMLKCMDIIMPVSYFTKEKMKALIEIPEEKFAVPANCLDPFLPMPSSESRRHEFRSSYGFSDDDTVLMTLSRLSTKEKNKGYDKVLFAVKKLHASFPHLKYLLVGKYEEEEKIRLESVIHDLGIEYAVTFTGFVPDSVIGDYYNMADVCILPGEKESFGISVIEALYYNKPVIAGMGEGIPDNFYGNGQGTLIDFRNQDDITAAIQKVITNVKAFIPDSKLVIEKFSYPVYKNIWKKVLDESEGSTVHSL